MYKLLLLGAFVALGLFFFGYMTRQLFIQYGGFGLMCTMFALFWVLKPHRKKS